MLILNFYRPHDSKMSAVVSPCVIGQCAVCPILYLSSKSSPRPPSPPSTHKKYSGQLVEHALESPSWVYAVSWLCLLSRMSPIAMAVTVEDTDPTVHSDNTWTIDGYYKNSGSSAHHTNITGGTATYSFTGEGGAFEICLCTLVPPSSDARGEWHPSIYPAGIAPLAASRGRRLTQLISPDFYLLHLIPRTHRQAGRVTPQLMVGKV